METAAAVTYPAPHAKRQCQVCMGTSSVLCLTLGITVTILGGTLENYSVTASGLAAIITGLALPIISCTCPPEEQSFSLSSEDDSAYAC